MKFSDSLALIMFLVCHCIVSDSDNYVFFISCFYFPCFISCFLSNCNSKEPFPLLNKTPQIHPLFQMQLRCSEVRQENVSAHLRWQTKAQSIRNSMHRHTAALTNVIVLSGTCIFHFSCHCFIRPQSRSCNHSTRQNEFEELAVCICLPRCLNFCSASSLPGELNLSVQ